jgi:2-oxoglutarate dehydrogenase E2 component (dihydrolipoamide succinyltransferase)
VLSPVVRRLIAEYGIDAGLIAGTGLGGRVSRDDVQRYIEANQLRGGAGNAAQAPAAEPAAEPAPPPAPAAPAPVAPAAAEPSAAPVPAPAPRPVTAPLVEAGARDAVVPLTNIRLRTGEHMVMSKAVAPHTLTAIEVDYENVEQVRRARGPAFKESEGFSLTYLPFICRATIDALREYPHLNASVGERELVVHNYVNLAIAVDLDFQGLLAPVVRDADGKRMRSIARDISDLARRARSKQLSPDELTAGTFTLTNAGSYGTMMQFPIINQPQVAILSTDAVKRRPVVIEDAYGNESIAIHSVGVLAMAWDHRAIDGAYAAAFLARVKEVLETRDWDSELA